MKQGRKKFRPCTGVISSPSNKYHIGKDDVIKRLYFIKFFLRTLCGQKSLFLRSILNKQ